MYIPDIWDTVVFILYAVFEFTSAYALFEQDELTPWAYYAMATFAYALIHALYLSALLVLTFVDMYAFGT